MNIEYAIDQVGLSVIAERMGTYSQRISNWRSRGVPLDNAVDFCRAVDWMITPHQLFPKHYPSPHDGLPEEIRQSL